MLKKGGQNRLMWSPVSQLEINLRQIAPKRLRVTKVTAVLKMCRQIIMSEKPRAASISRHGVKNWFLNTLINIF